MLSVLIVIIIVAIIRPHEVNSVIRPHEVNPVTIRSSHDQVKKGLLCKRKGEGGSWQDLRVYRRKIVHPKVISLFSHQ